MTVMETGNGRKSFGIGVARRGGEDVLQRESISRFLAMRHFQLLRGETSATSMMLHESL